MPRVVTTGAPIACRRIKMNRDAVADFPAVRTISLSFVLCRTRMCSSDEWLGRQVRDKIGPFQDRFYIQTTDHKKCGE